MAVVSLEDISIGIKIHIKGVEELVRRTRPIVTDVTGIDKDGVGVVAVTVITRSWIPDKISISKCSCEINTSICFIK